MVNYLFTDMDGTLLDEQGYVTPETVQAIKDSQLPLSLVSARSPMEMDEVIEALHLETLQVAFNGGLIYRPTPTGKELYYQIPLEFEVAKRLVLELRSTFPALSISFYDVDHWFTDQLDAGIELEKRITRQDYTQVNFEEQLNDSSQTLFKIMIIAFNEMDLEAIETFVRTHYGNEYINVQRSGNFYLEITHLEAQKAKGIAFILEAEGLSVEEVVAFGDGHNDISMLELVGTAIVMDNASDEVKQYADYITKTNTQNGVAYALRHYIR